MKATQKKMFLLKNTGSRIFDEAYFILKDHIPTVPPTESDMIREANRIVNENLISGYFRAPDRKRRRADLRAFFAGMLFGILAAAAVAILVL